jgi:hypothetical protein
MVNDTGVINMIISIKTNIKSAMQSINNEFLFNTYHTRRSKTFEHDRLNMTNQSDQSVMISG